MQQTAPDEQCNECKICCVSRQHTSDRSAEHIKGLVGWNSKVFKCRNCSNN